MVESGAHLSALQYMCFPMNFNTLVEVNLSDAGGGGAVCVFLLSTRTG